MSSKCVVRAGLSLAAADSILFYSIFFYIFYSISLPLVGFFVDVDVRCHRPIHRLHNLIFCIGLVSCVLTTLLVVPESQTGRHRGTPGSLCKLAVACSSFQKVAVGFRKNQPSSSQLILPAALLLLCPLPERVRQEKYLGGLSSRQTLKHG